MPISVCGGSVQIDNLSTRSISAYKARVGHRQRMIPDSNFGGHLTVKAKGGKRISYLAVALDADQHTVLVYRVMLADGSVIGKFTQNGRQRALIIRAVLRHLVFCAPVGTEQPAVFLSDSGALRKSKRLFDIYCIIRLVGARA